MAQPSHFPAGPAAADYYGQIESGAAAIGALVASGDLAMPIPSCPAWTLRELAIHVGRAHRWSAQIAATRSPAFVEFRSVPDGKFPGDAAAQAGWLAAGARRAVAAFEEAGQDPVWWAFGPPAPAAVWARRMCHETLVHAADARLAAGQPPDLPPALAADAIDEWLTELMRPVGDEADPRAAALPPGTSLHVHATDADGEWLVSHGPGGVTAERGHAKADAAVTGPASALLLVLLRRAPADDPDVTVHGDPAVLTRWLAATPF